MNTQQYNRLLMQDIGDVDYWRFQSKNGENERERNGDIRSKLFWGFRYKMGSYKARKAGISHPSVMMKYKGDKFRLYGSPEDNKLFQHCKDILAGWKSRNRAETRALMPEYRAWLKKNKLQAKSNPFSYWLMNEHLNNLIDWAGRKGIASSVSLE